MAGSKTSLPCRGERSLDRRHTWEVIGIAFPGTCLPSFARLQKYSERNAKTRQAKNRTCPKRKTDLQTFGCPPPYDHEGDANIDVENTRDPIVGCCVNSLQKAVTYLFIYFILLGHPAANAALSLHLLEREEEKETKAEGDSSFLFYFCCISRTSATGVYLW